MLKNLLQSTSEFALASRRAPAIAAARQEPAPDTTQSTGLVAAKFSDMYRDHIAAAVDADKDRKISREEYQKQIVGAGGSQTQADFLYSRLDRNADGVVSISELGDTIAVPKIDVAALMLLSVQHANMHIASQEPRGDMLDSQGGVNAASADQMLAYLADKFPGNIGV